MNASSAATKASKFLTGQLRFVFLRDRPRLQRRDGWLDLLMARLPVGHWFKPLFWALIGMLAMVVRIDAQTSSSKGEAPSASATIAATVTNSLAGAREVRVGADPLPETVGINMDLRTLAVTVLDAATGRSLAGAEVLVSHLVRWNKPEPKRLTDDQGKFTVRFMPVPKEQRRQISSFGLSAMSGNHAQRAVLWTSSAGDVYAGMPPEVTLKLEKGIPIGGVVQDERAQPLPGVRVLLSGSNSHGFTMGGDERRTHEYSEASWSSKESPAARTDATGRWVFARFPSDLESVEVTFVRPDESQETFATSSDVPFRQRPLISLSELKAQTAVVGLRDGVTVRGLCVDEAGQPLSGVIIKEGYGHGSLIRVAEFTNGVDGRFERPHRASRQWIYTASRADRATVSVVAQVAPGMAEVRLVLPPARPVRLLVVDEAGQPMPDVEFTLDRYRTEAQILDWTATTDANGVAVWTNASTATVTLYANIPSLGATRKVKLTPGVAEQRLVLSKGGTEKIAVRMKAVDSATRQAVKVRGISVNYEGVGSPFKRLSEPNASEFSVEIRQTDFRVGIYPSYRLTLDADGYESLTTEALDFAEGNQELQLGLTPAGGVSEVIVLQPNGTPAAGAQLWAQATRQAGSLFINAPGRYYGDRLASEQANRDGRIMLPGAPKEAPVIIAHPGGFLDTTMEALRRGGEAHLKAYGAVESRLLVAGQPKSGVRVSLSTLSSSSTQGYHLSYSTTTGAEGRFTFTQVPSGEYKLYRWIYRPVRGGAGRAITETYQMPFTVRAGETNRLDYASTGRAVTGQASADQPEVAVDWRNDDHVLSLKLPAAMANSRPNREDFATLKAFQKANEASLRSGAQVEQAKAARTYQLVFEADGSFQVEDVPPGAYELRLRVTKPGDTRRSPFPRSEDELGSLVREVVVPEGKEPFDLGTLVVPIKGDSGLKKSVPLDLALQTFDGKAVQLAHYRGKPLLLVFWAAWSERSLEALAELRQWSAELGSPPGLTVLSVNVDDDVAVAERAVRDGGFAGSQTWLDPETRAKVTAALDVNTLPAFFLLDAEGRVVQRELEGERLRAAVKRALQRK